MRKVEHIEELITLVSALDRPALTRHFQTYRASFPIDFTTDFLDKLDVDRLRHIFIAMCLQSNRLPDPDMVAA